MIDRSAVEAVVHELQALLQGDGARLVIRQVDPSRSLVVLELDLSEAECEECVVPPALLAPIVRSKLEEKVPEELELVLVDPRSLQPEEGERVLPQNSSAPRVVDL